MRGSRRERGAPLLLGSRSSRSLFVKAREDRGAFADVYVAYHAPVLRYFARRTLDPDVAFDLVAETFAELLAEIGNFRGNTEEAGRSLMWTIARHKLADWVNRGQVERRAMQRIGMERPELVEIDYERIEELADVDGARKAVRDALDSLDADERRVLTLRVVDERSFAEIAEILGASSPAAARQRESKARRKLAEIIDAAETTADLYGPMGNPSTTGLA